MHGCGGCEDIGVLWKCGWHLAANDGPGMGEGDFDVVAGCPGAADGSSTTVLAVSRLAGTEQSVWLFSRAE